jgi:hypothetical protein
LATEDLDRDPLSARFATQYEVGAVVFSANSRAYAYRGVTVSEAMDGQPHEPHGIGEELDYIQYVSVLSSITKLKEARANGLPFLTKSLIKIDSAGD